MADPGLDSAEQEVAEEHVPISPHVVHETIDRNGQRELVRSNSSLAFSGLAADEPERASASGAMLKL